MPKNRTDYGKKDPLVRVEGDRIRALLDLLRMSNREAAKELGELGAQVRPQTLDYLTSDPPKQRRARQSVVNALAQLPDRLPTRAKRAPLPVQWFTDREQVLIQGQRLEEPRHQIRSYWRSVEIGSIMQAVSGHQSPAASGNALMALRSPLQWRHALFVDPPALTPLEDLDASEHLDEAFRILLRPLGDAAELDLKALAVLADLWKPGIDTTMRYEGDSE